MSDQNTQNERPEVYALRQNGGSWQISRRDFLKAASLGAAVMGIGMNSRFVKPAHAASDLETLCKSSPAHQSVITGLGLSVDGKYLLSADSSNQLKCWDFTSHALMKSTKGKFGEKLFAMGLVCSKPLALMGADNAVSMVELPEITEARSVNITVGDMKTSDINGLDAGPSGYIYGVSDKELFLAALSDDLKNSDQDVLYTKKNETGTFKDVKVLSEGQHAGEGRFLFVLKSSGYAVYDDTEKTMTEYENGISFSAFAILPGGAKALLCAESGKEVKLVSTASGSVLWNQTFDQTITAAAVTPDGSYGILAGSGKTIYLIDLSDGKEVRHINACGSSEAPIVVAPDGTSCAVAAEKSILFISLPDFEIIGCPVDLKEMKDDTKGIEIKGTDPLTGQTITYTLPCGSPIPEGAVCVCNCVAGSVCTCVGHTVCTCDTVCSCVGNTYTYCSCDTVCTCEGDGHYWYPD